MSILQQVKARLERAAIEAPYMSEPQTDLERVLLSGMELSQGTMYVGLQFIESAESPGARECRFQTSNVFESGWRLCQQLEQMGFERVLETDLVDPDTRQAVSVQYQAPGYTVWLIAHTISVSIIVFEGNRV